MDFVHHPVLLSETIDALHIRPDGLYCDCTAGGGGHAAAILSHLNEHGRLIAVDRDPDAIAVLQARFEKDARVRVVHSTFDRITDILGGRRSCRSRCELLPVGHARTRLFFSQGCAS